MDPSLKGRVLITKVEGILQLTYAALPLHVEKNLLNDTDKMLFTFVWRNKTQYLRKLVLLNTYDKGGLNFLDFSTLNNTFIINWVKNVQKHPNSTWNVIPLLVIITLGPGPRTQLNNYIISYVRY